MVTIIVILLVMVLVICLIAHEFIKHLKSIDRNIKACERILYRQERRQEYKK